MWESAGVVLTVVTPLVVVPLIMITFYLRSLREHQVTWQGQMLRRVEASESSSEDLRRTIRSWEREYTTKEEWLREGLHTRQTLERLKESTVRIEATLASVFPVKRRSGLMESPVWGVGGEESGSIEGVDDNSERHP